MYQSSYIAAWCLTARPEWDHSITPTPRSFPHNPCDAFAALGLLGGSSVSTPPPHQHLFYFSSPFFSLLPVSFFQRCRDKDGDHGGWRSWTSKRAFQVLREMSETFLLLLVLFRFKTCFCYMKENQGLYCFFHLSRESAPNLCHETSPLIHYNHIIHQQCCHVGWAAATTSLRNH